MKFRTFNQFSVESQILSNDVLQKCRKCLTVQCIQFSSYALLCTIKPNSFNVLPPLYAGVRGEKHIFQCLLGPHSAGFSSRTRRAGGGWGVHLSPPPQLAREPAAVPRWASLLMACNTYYAHFHPSVLFQSVLRFQIVLVLSFLATSADTVRTGQALKETGTPLGRRASIPEPPFRAETNCHPFCLPATFRSYLRNNLSSSECGLWPCGANDYERERQTKESL